MLLVGSCSMFQCMLSIAQMTWNFRFFIEVNEKAGVQGNYKAMFFSYCHRPFCLYVIRGCMYACVLSHVRLFVTPWTVVPPGSSVHGISQARILEWLPFPSPGDLPDPGIEPASPALAGGFFTTEPHEKSSPLSDTYFLPSKGLGSKRSLATSHISMLRKTS